jgi:F-type H+-transporting ATPase subunit b
MTRIRKTLVAAVTVGLCLGFAATAAHAGETTDTTAPEPALTSAEGGESGETGEEPELSEVGECVVEAVENGTDPADCQEAPNPILPATTEIAWGLAAFLVLLAVMWKFALPPVRKGMADRTERIRTDLERADQAKVEAEETLAGYNAQLADARNEANRIIEDARKTADALRADLQARAEAEIAEMRRRAAADIEAAKVQAVADLTTEVAELAIGAAEVIVEKNLDRETQVQLVENYINRVGAGA